MPKKSKSISKSKNSNRKKFKNMIGCGWDEINIKFMELKELEKRKPKSVSPSKLASLISHFENNIKDANESLDKLKLKYEKDQKDVIKKLSYEEWLDEFPNARRHVYKRHIDYIKEFEPNLINLKDAKTYYEKYIEDREKILIEIYRLWKESKFGYDERITDYKISTDFQVFFDFVKNEQLIKKLEESPSHPPSVLSSQEVFIVYVYNTEESTAHLLKGFYNKDKAIEFAKIYELKDNEQISLESISIDNE